VNRVLCHSRALRTALLVALGAGIFFSTPPRLSEASTGPAGSEGDFTSARIASGVVGSLALRAMLLSATDGQPVFTCECSKMTQVISTPRGNQSVPRTFCD
jgi:hypothetical protein